MPTYLEKIQKRPSEHSGKTQVLKKLSKSTKNVVNSTILPFLAEKGAEELSLSEIRNNLSKLKIPLSREIIKARQTS